MSQTSATRTVPRNIAGNSLLSGNVFCGHCGARLTLTTNGKRYPCKDDPSRIVKRVRYICYGKTRKQTECDGQTGYTASVLDGIIDKLIRQIFERMRAIPKSEIVGIRYQEKMKERKTLPRPPTTKGRLSWRHSTRSMTTSFHGQICTTQPVWKQRR
ncbi:MAG: zinc ribbon domain-containing protein [Oscillospiraceae bacterium]|nr:zinc ribbon domain-containing protein [Oscillospiraceae bacterium]